MDKLRKELELFRDLVADYIKEKDPDIEEEIVDLYKLLNEKLLDSSVEKRAVNTLMSLTGIAK